MVTSHPDTQPYALDKGHDQDGVGSQSRAAHCTHKAHCDAAAVCPIELALARPSKFPELRRPGCSAEALDFGIFLPNELSEPIGVLLGCVKRLRVSDCEGADVTDHLVGGGYVFQPQDRLPTEDLDDPVVAGAHFACVLFHSHPCAGLFHPSPDADHVLMLKPRGHMKYPLCRVDVRTPLHIGRVTERSRLQGIVPGRKPRIIHGKLPASQTLLCVNHTVCVEIVAIAGM